MKKIGNGLAYGKVIFMGEHAVVYGQPAIALPVKAYQAVCQLNPIDTDSSIESSVYTGSLSDAPEDFEGLIKMLDVLISDYPGVCDQFHLKIDSSVPLQRGLGSSAAISVACVRAFFDLVDLTLSDNQLFYYVDIAENIHHGSASGLDAWVISQEKAIYFEKNASPDIVDIKLQAYLLIVDTGVMGNTKEAVDLIAQARGVDGNEVDADIQQLGEFTQVARYYLENDNGRRVGIMMSSAHQVLSRLGVSSPELDECVQVCLESGAWGAKLTGGGLGGCLIALCEDLDVVNRIRQNLYQYDTAYFMIEGEK